MIEVIRSVAPASRPWIQARDICCLSTAGAPAQIPQTGGGRLLDARAGAAAALAGREASGAALRDLEDLAASLGLAREAVGERHAEPLDGRRAVGEHRLL